MSTQIDKLLTRAEKVTKTKEDFLNDYKDTFAKILMEAVKDSSYEYITWDQYAPYFNDGDPCIFAVWQVCGEKKIDIQKEHNCELKDATEDDLDAWSRDCIFEYSKCDDTRIIDIFDNVPEELFEAAFGSDSQVIVTEHSFRILECEHD